MNRHEKQSQKQFARQLIHRCDVFSKKRIRVGKQWQEFYVRVEEKTACRMSTNSPSNNEVIKEDQQKFFTPFKLFSLPMQIKSDDRVLLYVKRGDTWEPERFYEVKAEPRDPSFLQHHYETPCENMTTTYAIQTIVTAGIALHYLDVITS